MQGDINTPVSGDAVATNPALAIAPGAKATSDLISGITTAYGLGGFNRFKHAFNSIQADDDAFITHGTQSIRVGFAFERMQYNILEQLSPNGRLNTYGSLQNFLTNAPIQLNALAPGGSTSPDCAKSLFAGYAETIGAQESNLTLNLGPRCKNDDAPDRRQSGGRIHGKRIHGGYRGISTNSNDRQLHTGHHAVRTRGHQQPD